MLQYCGINKSQFDKNSNNKDSFNNPINSPPMSSNFNARSISSFSSYYFQTILITKDGTAMAIGNNTKGIINSTLPRQIITGFTKIEIKNQDGHLFTPISAVCGELYSLYLLSSDEVIRQSSLAYSCTSVKTDSPLFLNIGMSNPVALYGGFQHSAAIDEEGSILFIPRSIFKTPTALIEPTRLPNNEKAVCIACCNYSVFAVGSNGGLFVSNVTETKGKLAKLSFTRVGALEGKKIVEVSGTYGHCVATSDDGHVYGFGSNYNGQLGFDERIFEVTEFTEMTSLNKCKIVAAYAGTTHSLFQTEEGKILACGENKCGQLFSNGPSKDKVYSPIETEIKSGAIFCVTGDCCSFAFIDTDPSMSPNRRISPKKEKRLSDIEKENLSLKEEITKLKQRIKNLESQQQDQKKNQKTEKIQGNSNNFELLDQQTVNDMSIIETLGRGAQSEVFKVARPTFYVLKVLLQSNVKNKSKISFTQIKRFVQEYDILRLLNHQNIIRTFGFCYGDETHPPSILLQFCPHNLCDIIEEMNSFQKVCSIFEICLGMEAVHAANLIHRDLKPENILIDEEGHVKISDFGVSCLVDLESQTQSKTTGVGTLKFMAPELLNENEHYNNKVDVYSFGVVAFYILTGGKMPKISFAEQVTGKKAQIPSEINEISRNLINSCWSVEPEDRPSFTKIIEDIKSDNFKIIDGIEKDIVLIKKFLSLND